MRRQQIHAAAVGIDAPEVGIDAMATGRIDARRWESTHVAGLRRRRRIDAPEVGIDAMEAGIEATAVGIDAAVADPHGKNSKFKVKNLNFGQ